MSPAAEPRPRDLLAAISSPLAMVSLALPLVLAGAWAAVSGRGPAPFLGATSVWIWGALLGTSIAAASFRATAEGRWQAALGWAGLFAVLLQVPVSWTRRFDGVCDAGEGEVTPRWREMREGFFVRPPRVEVIEIAPLEGGVARIRARGEVAMLRLGEKRTLGDVSVKLTAFGPAPSFALSRKDGEVVEEGLLKIASDDEGYVQLGTLPHRFHLALPGGTTDIVPPEVLRVRVERGKLVVVADRELRRQEPLAFEGLVFRWDHGTRWARLEVATSPRPLLAVLGGVLLLEALGAAFLARRRS